MKVLFITEAGDSADIAFRMQTYGHEVRLYIDNKDYKDVYDGIVPKVSAYAPSVGWSDLVVFDGNYFGGLGDGIRRMKPVLGGGKFAWSLEENRKSARDILKSIGLQVTKSNEFTEIEKTKDFIKAHPARYVVKNAEIEGKFATYVGELEDGRDSIDFLDHLKQRKDLPNKIEIEERVYGVEIGISAWFNQNIFMPPWEINFEHKRLAAGDLGHLTGEMGTTIYNEYDPEHPLFLKVLHPLTEILSKEKYAGQIDVNCIANEDGLWGLEFTPRLGYPSIYILDELQRTDWAELWLALAKGKDIDNDASTQWANGVMIVTEGFPFKRVVREMSSELPLLFPEESAAHIHLVEAKLKGGRFVTTGTGGLAACVAGSGDTLEKAISESYALAQDFHVNNKLYRIDIGERVFKDIETLNSLGWKIKPSTRRNSPVLT